MITQAAIKTKDGKVYTGRRHHNVLNENHGVNFIGSIQGFVNDSGVFKDRGCSYHEAKKFKQIKNDKLIGNVLTSEDLW